MVYIIYLSRISPKLWFYFQFVQALNQTAQVVTENLAESFVDLRGLRLAAKRIGKLFSQNYNAWETSNIRLNFN